MPVITLPIAAGFYVSDALPISAQRCVNWRPNVPQTRTITDANLFSTDGLVELAKVSEINHCRGAHVINDVPYFVIGTLLYRLNQTFDINQVESFDLENLGAIAGNDRVSMADNGLQLCIVAKPDNATTGKSYIFTTSPDALAEITDPNFDGPVSSVSYVDGFFVFHKSDGKKFLNSPFGDGRGLPDGSAYDALDFSSATADPDQIRGIPVYRNQINVLGSLTTEIFRNIARVPSPFQRIAGAVIDIGLFAPDSTEIFSGSLVFIGGSVNESPAVWSLNGAQKQKLSTTAIDNELSKLSDAELGRVFSWTYADGGGYFYGITLPNTTFVFDSVNKRWHERTSTIGSIESQYRVSHMVTAYGRVLVGDSVDGRVGQLKKGVYTEYNKLSRRYVTSQPFDNNGSPMFVAGVEAVIEAGVGLTADVLVEDGVTSAGVPIEVKAGFDPKITIAWSDDGGRTFKGWLSRSMGKMGEYKRRPIWRRLGRFPRSRVLLFEVSSPTKATLIKVEANING